MKYSVSFVSLNFDWYPKIMTYHVDGLVQEQSMHALLKLTVLQAGFTILLFCLKFYLDP